MNNSPKIPDRETIDRHVAKLREVCRQYDILNELLDRAIASAEEDIRNSPLGAYRLRKAKETALQTSTNESDS